MTHVLDYFYEYVIMLMKCNNSYPLFNAMHEPIMS
jgi:hypothetical protein